VSHPPLKRFLGLDETDDPLALLGLRRGTQSAAEIDAALARRLAMIADHPDGRSLDATAVNLRLRRAAAALKTTPSVPTAPPASAAPAAPAPPPPAPRAAAEPVRPRSFEHTLNPRPPAPLPPPTAMPATPPRPLPRAHARPRIRLTAFDQQVLAVLVSCGGWNARARSRMVAVAARYGVSVHGLLKVIRGLGEYARAGGPRLEVSQITAGQSRLESPEVPAPMAPLLQKIGAQFDERPLARLRMAALVGLTTILVGVLVLQLVLGASEPTRKPHVAPGPVPGPGAAGPAAPAAPPGAAPEPGPGVAARFDRFPSFLGNALPAPAAAAADGARQIPGVLDEVARRLTVSDRIPEPVLRSWEEAIEVAATGWVLVDESTRGAIHSALLDVLYAAADEPQSSDRLLLTLLPTGALTQPIDLWRGAWCAGTLGIVAGHPNLPPVVVDQARRQLDTVVARPADPPRSFAAAASAWLSDRVPGFVRRLDIDDAVEDRWELWLAAQRALDTGELLQAALGGAIRELLAAGGDLSRAGPGLNLLGRLLRGLDLVQSPAARAAILGLFDDPAVSTADLWLLTSLMAQLDTAPWFEARLVLPHDADERMRRRVADGIGRIWPAAASRSVGALAAGTGTSVDARVLERWRGLEPRVAALAAAVPAEALLGQIAAAAQFNTAAALLAAQHPDEADEVLDEVIRLLAADSPLPASRLTAGQPVGADGEWTASFQASRSADDKVKWLRALRNTAGTDLGPLDADTLVAEALRGGAGEVGSTARGVIVEQFQAGPQVAQELLDQFTDLRGNEFLADFIERLTGELLPPSTAAGWAPEARLALARHALRLRPSRGVALDQATVSIREAYSRHLRGLRPGASLPPPASEEAEDLASAVRLRWLEYAATLMVALPVPDSLAGLERMHRTRLRLAEGPIQRFVAEQVGVLELLAYVTVAEQPVLGPAVRQVVGDALAARRDLPGVLAQALSAEQAMSRVWSMRMVGSRREGRS
jgi:hypothetical protein